MNVIVFYFIFTSFFLLWRALSVLFFRLSSFPLGFHSVPFFLKKTLLVPTFLRIDSMHTNQ